MVAARMLWLCAASVTLLAIGCSSNTTTTTVPYADATDTQAADADAQGSDVADTHAADADAQGSDAAETEVADADAQGSDAADVQVQDVDAQVADADAQVADADAQVADADAQVADVPVPAAPIITILNFTFEPVNLDVAPGGVVTVVNMDSVPHTVTSQATAGAFKPGAVAGVSFDTGSIAGGATAQFTIPLTAPAGTVVPYFCAIHAGLMKNAPKITVK